MARPRDPSVEPRIMAAATSLLAEGGYDALTMEAVANRAGVGKPTVYRRWSTRAQLVFELDTSAAVPDPLPDTGSFRGDIVEALWWLAETMMGVDRKIIGDQFGEMVAVEEFARKVWERRLKPDRDQVLAVWDRAAERGEARADIDGAEVLDDLVGVLMYRILVRHEPTSRADIERMVDRITTGVLDGDPATRRQPTGAGRSS
ncbi:MAG: TetR/AcrR family transcriptional regulator [Ilumatobacteraceae bacterium]